MLKKITIKKITIKSGTKYLGEAMPKLPSNCLFDKGRVGCGGTSIALESDVPYVIAVPFIPLIQSKVSQYNGKEPHERYSGQICGVMGGVSQKDVDKYLAEVKEKGWTPRFMVTYDSLKKLSEWINPKEYNLLVDELHILFTSYDFREEAIQSVLQIFLEYKEYCFMTASVLENEFLLEELINIPIVEAVWEDKEVITIHSVKCETSIRGTIKWLIERYLDGTNIGNAYFFVNSVKFIKQMVKACKLNNKNTRVIYSSSNDTEVGIKRGSPMDEPKKINFITSTAFEGADFLDENGVIFIVSDNNNPNTLVDISTSVIQISGRIRDTKYWKDIYHVYTPTRYNKGVIYDEIKKSVEETKTKTNSIIDEFNALSDDAKTHASLNINEIYVTRKGLDYKYDPNKFKTDLYNFKVTRCLYRSRKDLKDEYRKYGFKVTASSHEAQSIPRMDEVEGITLQQAIEKLEKVWDEGDFSRNGMLAAIKGKYPLLPIFEAIQALGFDGIKECKYSIRNINYRLKALSYKGSESEICKMFKNLCSISTGDFISSKDAKKILTKIYQDLNLDKTALGTDLKLYFDVKNYKNKIGGKSVDGFIFLSDKALY